MKRLFKYCVPDSPGWQTWRHWYEFATPTAAFEQEFRDETGISLIDFGNLLQNCGPMIHALAFMGYDVSTVEVERHNRTARADIRNESIAFEKSTRPVDALHEPHRIRFYIEKVTSPNAPPPVPIGTSHVDDYINWFGSWYDKPMTDVNDHYLSHAADGLGLGASQGELPVASSLAEIVEANLRALIAGGLDGPVTLESGLAAPGVPGGAYFESMGSGIVDIMSEMILAPVAAFLQWRVGLAADAWFRAGPAAGQTRPAGALPPGRLGVLDPANWHDGARVIYARLGESDHRKMGRGLDYIKTSYGLILQSMEKEAFTDPAPPGNPPGRYIDKPGQDFFMAGLSSHRCPFLQKPLPAGLTYPVSAASAIVQRITEGRYYGADVVVYADATAKQAAKDLGLYQLYHKDRYRADTLLDPPHLAGVLALARQFDNAQYLRFPKWRALGTAKEAEDLLTLLGATGGSPYYLYQQISEGDYLSGLNALMYLGLFSVDHLLGLPGPDEDVIAPEYDIIAEEVAGAPDQIRLTLPDYLHQGIVLSLTASDLGYSLQDGVTWTYIPPPQKIPHAATEDARRRIGGNSNPKIVLVAAPGVAIHRIEWPSSVDMEVIRVQDIGQVPPPDTPINPLLYSATKSIPISEIATPEHLDADPALRALYDTLGEDAKHFNVVVKPSNMPARIADGQTIAGPKTGVSILIPATDLSHPHTPLTRLWPGPTRKAALHLEVDALSGAERFAYEMRPRRASEPRAGGIDGGLVDYIGIEVSVHATHRFESKTVREDVMQLGDPLMPLTAGFWQADALRDVAPQGGGLGFPGANQPATGDWVELEAGEMPVFAQSSAPLTYHTHPFDQAADDYLWSSVIFWSQLSADVGIGVIPIVGDVVDAVELAMSLYTGTDKWGQPVTHAQQVMMLGGALLPFASSGALKAMAKTVDPANTTDYLAAIRGP